MKYLSIALVTVGALIAGTAGAQDDPVVLRLNSIAPPTHWFTTELMPSWQSAVEEATEGRVKVEATDAPLGPMPRAMDMVAQGVADVSAGNHGPIQGRFGVTQILDIPFLANDTVAASVALWRVNEEFLSAAGEHDDVVLLSLWASSPGNIFMAKGDLNGPEDMQGKKIVVVSPTAGKMAQTYGAVTVAQPTSEWYETLSRGVADGVISTNTAIAGWPGLIDLMENNLHFEQGMHYATFFLVMNKDKWSEISEADQKAIMDVSGEAFAKEAGQAFWDKDKEAMETIRAAKTNVIVASPDLIEGMKSKLSFLEEEWIAKAKEAGVDGEAALAKFREIAAQQAE